MVGARVLTTNGTSLRNSVAGRIWHAVFAAVLVGVVAFTLEKQLVGILAVSQGQSLTKAKIREAWLAKNVFLVNHAIYPYCRLGGISLSRRLAREGNFPNSTWTGGHLISGNFLRKIEWPFVVNRFLNDPPSRLDFVCRSLPSVLYLYGCAERFAGRGILKGAICDWCNVCTQGLFGRVTENFIGFHGRCRRFFGRISRTACGFAGLTREFNGSIRAGRGFCGCFLRNVNLLEYRDGLFAHGVELAIGDDGIHGGSDSDNGRKGKFQENAASSPERHPLAMLLSVCTLGVLMFMAGIMCIADAYDERYSRWVRCARTIFGLLLLAMSVLLPGAVAAIIL